MQFLELKIPPVILVLLTALAMWGASSLPASFALPLAAKMGLAICFILAGTGISLAGVFAFHQARTTVDPTRPNAASNLVCLGVYQFTRNPMYLGFLLVLLGYAVFLANLAALLGPVLFVLYMNRFQIIPEERALTAIFGEQFRNYQRKVRRWL